LVLHNLVVALWGDIVDAVMGIMTSIHQASGPNGSAWGSALYNPRIASLSISVSLNILLTIMIVTRLILHSKNIRSTMGSPAGVCTLYKTITTVLVESSTLYSMSSLLVVGQSSAGLADTFLSTLSEIQVRASP